jgi:GNAT superfamily N-acetyltransferase
MSTTYRPGTLDDMRPVFDMFRQSLKDLLLRKGWAADETWWQKPEEVDWTWSTWQDLLAFLTINAEQYWVAENDGQIIGFARSFLDDNVRELTEFFVRPGTQSAGVGRGLLERAFPATGAQIKCILATTDVRAQTLYLKNGVYPRFVIQTLYREPEAITLETDLVFKPITNTPEIISALRTIDHHVLSFERDRFHQFLADYRKGFLFYRNEQPVGYGYFGIDAVGPIALLQESDYPAILAYAENEAFKIGWKRFGVELPMINRSAVDYLLSRGYRLENFRMLFMSNEPFGNFEKYIVAKPAFLL